MEWFSKRNLFIYCWIAACLSLLTYLIAFSCEVSWILEARGDLPTPAYFLCSIFFVLFIASTILIHGLATGLSWGLFSWSAVIGTLAIPELCLVMYMTSQFWGLDSNHGIIELISYLIRLIFNCLALMCVIPTGLSWRHEKKILSQLESLAARLQLTSPSANLGPFNNTLAPPKKSLDNDGTTESLRGSKKVRNISRRPSNCVANGVDNQGFVAQETAVDISKYPYSHYGSQNEFDASIFGLNPGQYIGPPVPNNLAKKTQSLLDLRYFINTTTTTTKIVSTTKDEPDSVSLSDHNNKTSLKNKINNSKFFSHKKKNSENDDARTTTTEASTDDDKLSSRNDPVYSRIESPVSKKSLSRNCVSLENLGALTTTIKNDLGGYGPNFVPVYFAYHQPHVQQRPMYYPYPYIPQYYNGQYHYPNSAIPMPYFHPYQQQQQQPQMDYNYNNYHMNSAYFSQQPGVFGNSRQSLGNVSDDFRKYRDVAL